MAIHLVQIDEDLWVNPNEVVAVYSDDDITYISAAINEFAVIGQSVAEVVGRLAAFVNMHYEE